MACSETPTHPHLQPPTLLLTLPCPPPGCCVQLCKAAAALVGRGSPAPDPIPKRPLTGGIAVDAEAVPADRADGLEGESVAVAPQPSLKEMPPACLVRGARLLLTQHPPACCALQGAAVVGRAWAPRRTEATPVCRQLSSPHRQRQPKPTSPTPHLM